MNNLIGSCIKDVRQKSGFSDPLPHVSDLNNKISLTIAMVVRIFWDFLDPLPLVIRYVLYGWPLRTSRLKIFKNNEQNENNISTVSESMIQGEI